MSEILEQDSSIAVVETPDGEVTATAVDDEARLTVEDALEITQMLDEAPAETFRYGRTYWMESVGHRVGLGAAGVRGAEVQIDTGRQRPVRVVHRIGRQALGTGRQQLQASAR